MKTSNPFSSKLFTVAAGISIVLCSASLLLFTLNHMSFANAETNNLPASKLVAPWDAELRGAAGLGIVKDTAYFVVWANPNILYKASIRKAQDWYKN